MRSYLIGFAAMVFSTLAVAQGQLVNPDIVPQVSSPEAAELGKHISVPVSLNTGTPNISILLYTINYGGMQVPITLNYDASGVKVDELASNVGLKWSLDYGGAVTRIVKGGRDEGISNSTSSFGVAQGYYKDFGISSIPPVFSGLTGDAAGIQFTNLSEGLAGGQNDGQPDLFSFNAMGFTGRFFFDQNRNPVIFTETDFKVSTVTDMVSSVKSFNEFKITTSSGLEMNFGTGQIKENSYTGGSFTIPFGGMTDNAWMLTSVKNLSNDKIINFNYATEKFSDIIVSNKDLGYVTETYNGTGVIYPYTGPLTCIENPDLSPSYSYSQAQTQRVNTITAGKTTIEFLASARQDIYLSGAAGTPVQKIDQIIVKYDGACVKKFRLNYAYFSAVGEIAGGGFNVNFENTAKKRLKLVSLEEMDCADKVVKKHEFFYDETYALPVRYSFGKDKWGFYNGKILNQTLYPKISPDCPAYSWIADRKVSPAHLKAGTLNKIIYPTKGSVEFTYENHVNDQVVDPNQQLGWTVSNDVATITSPTNIEEEVFTAEVSDYKIDINLYNGVPWYHPSPTSCPGFEIVKAVELINNATGAVVYQRFFGSLVSNNGTVINDSYAESNNLLTLQSGTSYTLRAYSMTDSGGAKCFTAQAKLSKFGTLAPIAQDFYVGGLRVKNVVFKDGVNPVLTNTYTYELPKLIDNPTFYYTGEFNVDITLGAIRSLNNYSSFLLAANLTFASGKFKALSVGTNPKPIDFMGSHISYQKVTEVNSEGKKVYHYYPPKTYFEASGYSSSQFYPYKPVFQSSLAGRLTSEETFNASNQLIREVRNAYEITSIEKNIDALVASKLPTPNQPSMNIIPFEFYKVKPEYSVLKNTITTDYFQGAPVQTSTEYFYEGTLHHQPTKIVTVDSKGDQQTTENQYPPDVPLKPYMSDLIAQNRISTPVVSKSLQGTTLLSQQEIVFSKGTTTSNFVLPTEALITKGIGGADSRVKYEKYDAQGNILQYRLTDGTPTSFLWGYDNQFPVARVDNATYDQILATGVVLATVNNPATSDAAMRTELQKIRTALPNAQTTTYTYDPLTGVTSITDPKGYVAYYNYDEFNRLAYVSDQNGKVVQKYRYHYALPEIMATTTASAPTVNSGAIVTFTTNASGGTGNFSYKWTVSNAMLNQTTTTSTGSFSVATTASHTPSFTLTCEITDTQTGDKTTTTTQVAVNTFSPLSASTTASSTSVTSGATVSFTTVPTGGSGNFSYKWTVSNANLNQVTTTSTGSFSVTTTTSHAPSFTLTNEVTDTQTGEKVTTSKVITVSTFSVGNITYSPTGGTRSVNTAMAFNITASGGSGNFIYEWKRINNSGTSGVLSVTSGLFYTISSSDCSYFTIQCKVTDTSTGATITKTVGLTVSCF